MNQQFLASKWLQQINQKYFWQDRRIDSLLEDASYYLGEFNSLLTSIPDSGSFIYMHLVREAIASSKLDGIKIDFRDDWQEIQNYIQASNHAVAKLKKLPLSMRLIKEAHKILLSKNLSRKYKQAGKTRKTQKLLLDLEKFIHNDTLDLPHLIKAAILHYQFETIQPFSDASSRMTSLLTTLYLVDKCRLHQPALYLSDFFESNREAYYDSLALVRTMNDLDQWLRFFLSAVIHTAQSASQEFKRLIDFRQKFEDQIASFGSRSSNARKILLKLFTQPIVDYETITDLLDVSHPTANRYLKDFQSLGILQERTGYKKNRSYEFQVYRKFYDR